MEKKTYLDKLLRILSQSKRYYEVKRILNIIYL